MLASESYPRGFFSFGPEHFHDSSRQYAEPPSLEAYPMSPVAGWTLNALPSDLQSLFRTNVIRTWMDVIEHYAGRGLTKKKDSYLQYRLLPGTLTLFRNMITLPAYGKMTSHMSLDGCPTLASFFLRRPKEAM
jgi:hypothetical protein